MKAPTTITDDEKSELLALADEAQEMQSTLGGTVTETVADWLAPKYALAARRRLAAEDEAGQLEILRAFVVDWALLRGSHFSAQRLQIQREWLKLARARTKERMEELFEKWAQDPEKMEKLRGGTLSQEERAARIRQILGYPPRSVPSPTTPAPEPSASTDAPGTGIDPT